MRKTPEIVVEPLLPDPNQSVVAESTVQKGFDKDVDMLDVIVSSSFSNNNFLPGSYDFYNYMFCIKA